MKPSILIDTSPLVGIISPRDSYHRICLDALKTIDAPLLTTWLVLTEAHWLLRKDSKAIASLFKIIEGGIVEIVELPKDSISWLKQFLIKYQDVNAQIADASLCYLAETYSINTVFTMDKRDFFIYRVNNHQALNIIP